MLKKKLCNIKEKCIDQYTGLPSPAGSTCYENHCKKTTQGGDIIMSFYHNSEKGGATI